MSDNDSSDTERVVRSFNFRKIVVERTHRGIEATKQKRMDRFVTGMEPVGRPRRMFGPLTETEARLLYEALGELLDQSADAGGGDE